MGTFAETGDKAPHPAVKIKMYTMLEYKDEDAIDYAREHLPGALKLDKRVFARAAKAVAMNFVAILQEPRATIARDLSKYLPTD
jgi:3-mercaptopyruvate sulfurtransferase SseA